MFVWRLTTAPYADLTGEGAAIVGGRWNNPGRPVLYTSLDPALAVLETRVPLDLPFDLLPDSYVLMQIDTHDLPVEQMDLPKDPEACRRAGDLWLQERRTPLLEVPSVIIPASHNLLINPRHPDAGVVSMIAVEPYSFDERLWANGLP